MATENVDHYRACATICHTVRDVANLDKELSGTFYVRGILWSLKISRNRHVIGRPALGVFVQCHGEAGSTAWTCYAKASIKLLGAMPNRSPITTEFSRLFCHERKSWGIQSVVLWHFLGDYIKNNTITVEVHLAVDVPRGVSWDTKAVGELRLTDRESDSDGNTIVAAKHNKLAVEDHEETEAEAAIRESLRCPVCHQTMQAPIHQCVKGHSHCDACRKKIKLCSLCRDHFSKARNIKLEQLSESVVLSCEDCHARIPAHLMTVHLKKCPGQLSCCLLKHPTCNWQGLQTNLLAHSHQFHADLIWHQTPHVFIHSDFEGSLLTNFILYGKTVFVFTRKYVTAQRQLCCTLRHLKKPTDCAVKFGYKLQLMNESDRERLVYRREACLGEVPVLLVLKEQYTVTVKNEVIIQFKRGTELMFVIEIYVSS